MHRQKMDIGCILVVFVKHFNLIDVYSALYIAFALDTYKGEKEIFLYIIIL